MIGEIVKTGDEAKKLGEARIDGNGKKDIPDEKLIDTNFARIAFFPGDFGVEDVGENGSKSAGDEAGEPEKAIIINDEIGEDGVGTVIKNRKNDSDNKITTSAMGSLNVDGLASLIDSFGSFGSFGDRTHL